LELGTKLRKEKPQKSYGKLHITCCVEVSLLEYTTEHQSVSMQSLPQAPTTG